MSLAELKLTSPLILDLQASSEEEAIKAAVGMLTDSRDVTDFDQFREAIFERQKVNPPLLGRGIALPHARTHAVKNIVFAIVRLHDVVSFGPDAIPVRLMFLFGTPPQKIGEYLALTAQLVKCLRSAQTVESLLSASSAEEFLNYLV